MNEKNKNLLVRIATAVVAIPIVLFLLWKGGYWLAVLLGWAAGTCAGEYYWITQAKKLEPIAWVGIAFAAAMPFLPVWKPEAAAVIAFWLVAAFFFIVWTYHLLRGPLPEAPARAGNYLVGLLYGGIGLFALSGVRTGRDGLDWVVAALVITWLNDTCAYFAGRFLGKRKLYPAVSPNKTWEGFAGGMVGSIGGMLVYRLVWFHGLTVRDCLIVGFFGGVLGPIGDLCESMLKRAYGVKDSGKVIPGHGGLLDRIDALIFNAPMVFVYVQFIRRFL